MDNKDKKIQELETKINQLEMRIKQLEDRIDDIEYDVGATQSELINKRII